jgi:hypothetical protein
MRTFKLLILPAFVLAFWTNYTFGAITGISILNSSFRAEGHIQDDSYLVEDPIYASGSTRYSPYSPYCQGAHKPRHLRAHQNQPL